MKYADMDVPPRSSHLWRYTPWNWMHPTKVDEIPQTLPLRFDIEGPHEMVIDRTDDQDTHEYARLFLRELNAEKTNITTTEDHQVIHIRINASGHIASGHMHLNIQHASTIIVHLSGEAEWCGLRVTAEVRQNVFTSFAIINELSSTSTLLECHDWMIPRDASVEFAGLTIGGFRIKSDIRTQLSGHGSSMNQALSTHGLTQRHADHHVEIHHLKGHTLSNLSMHAACDDQSHLISTGLLTIAKDANHSDAGQVFRNLLLSPTARAESLPELEVLADEVAAAHGAASAPVDEHQLHYMMTRGFSKDEATALIVEGFLTSAFHDIKSPDVLDALRTRLTVHLECHIKR